MTNKQSDRAKHVRASEAHGDSSPQPAWLSLPRRYNCATHFVDRHLVEGRGDNVAFIDDHGSYTYAELASRVNRAGNLLRGLGVEMEQRVILCLLDSIDFPTLFWGAIKIGAVPVPVYAMLAPADWEFMLRDSRARVLVVSAQLLERFEPILSRLPHLKALVVCDEAPTRGNCGGIPVCGLDALSAEASDKLEPADTTLDDTAFWLYSSGSTGTPKGVIHLQGDLQQTGALTGEHILCIREDDVMYTPSKFSFALGLIGGLSMPMHAGAASIMTAERPTPEGVMRLMRKHRPTLFFSVPTLYARILADSANNRSTGSDRLRMSFSSGEALPEEIAARWRERFGTEIADVMGTTETLCLVIGNRPGHIRYGTSGKAAPGWDVRLLHPDGRKAATGEIGDLWVRGPSTCAGYWNNWARSKSVFIGPWWRTGDKLWRDEEGYFHYAGRSDDMLKAGGIWVSPFEVESALMAHPDVLEAAVIGAADRDGMIKPKAFVQLKPGIEQSPDMAEALKAFVKSRLAPFKYPRWIEFCEDMPKTATGKIQRFKLRAS